MVINLDNIRLPKRISPCPIVEAVVELRFDSPFPHDAIFGVLYNEFKKDYPNVEELPILQLPEVVRKQDPNLKFKPYYKLSKDKKSIFQVGARLISLINLNPYDGWDNFSGRLDDVLKRVKKLEIVSFYSRVGIRYINGFDCNIFEKINLSLSMGVRALTDVSTSMRLEIPTSRFVSTLMIANNAKVTKADTTTKGSIIDIDTFIENPKDDVSNLIKEGHLEEKKLFFSLLKKDFLEKELNPEY